jgi:hypothetical protein
MPFPIPATPWLKPADQSEEYMRGAQLGLQAGEARNRTAMQAQQMQQQAAQHAQQIDMAKQRLEQQAQHEQMALQVQQEMQQKKALVDQQKIEVAKSYHESQLGLQQQKLDEAKQKMQAQVQATAQKAASMMEYESRVKGGEDPNKVMMEIGPRMGASASGLASVSRAQQASVPKNLELRNEGNETFYRSSPTERYQHVPKGSSDRFLGNTIATHTMARINKIEEDLAVPELKAKERKLLESELTQKKKIINEIAKGRKQPVEFPEVEATTKSSKGATHRYIPGQGIVPIEQEQEQDQPEE